MEVEINVWLNVKTSGACPRKRTFAVSMALASAIENFVLTYLTGTIFNHFPSLFFLSLCCIRKARGTPDLHPCKECLWRVLVRGLGMQSCVGTRSGWGTLCGLSRGKEQEHHWVQGKREPVASYSEVPECLGTSRPVWSGPTVWHHALFREKERFSVVWEKQFLYVCEGSNKQCDYVWLSYRYYYS